MFEFLTRKNKKPDWVQEVTKDGVYVIDPDIAFPLYMKKLDLLLGMEVTQYKLEVARRCFTEDLREFVGGPLHIRIIKGQGNQWRLSNFPVDGVRGDAAAGAAQFRRYYSATMERAAGAAMLIQDQER